MNNREPPTEGAPSCQGEILPSLQTGGAVWGKIQEREDMVTTLLDSGTPMRHVTRREITLQKICRPAFERAGEPEAGRSCPFVLNDSLPKVRKS